MTLRTEEVFAQKAFTKALGNVTSVEGQDPPDLVFDVAGAKWAVEVTTFHQYLERNGDEASRTEFDKRARALIERLDRGVPSGKGFILCVGSWLKNPDLPKLEEWARQYIASGEVAETHFNGVKEIWIKADTAPTGKVGMIAGILDLMTLPDKDKSIVADIQATVDYGAKRIVDDKAPKLAKLEGYDKTVLLIVNDGGYPFLDANNLRVALAKAPVPAELKGGVYLVNSDGSVALVA